MIIHHNYTGSYPAVPDYLNTTWREFFATENTRSSGHNLYEDVFNAGILFPLQRKGELTRMMSIARETNPKIVYEIGCDKGGGLYHWCKCFPTVQKVVACELRGIPYYKEFEEAFPHIEFLWIEASSYNPEIVEKVREFTGPDQLDCIFIDGDKSNFHTDFYAYRNQIRPGGVAFMHDVQENQPRASFQTVIREYRSEVIIDKTDTLAELVREQNGEPVRNGHEGWLRHWRGRSCGVGVIYID